MKTQLLTLKKVSKSFGPTNVLDGVDFSIAPGEIVALLGDNGAGKSTLIKIISGFHTPTLGEMLWEGEPITASQADAPSKARARGVETVYQDLGLVETLPIWRNFFLGREMKTKFLGLPALAFGKMQEITREKLKEIGIRRALDPQDLVVRLSGGERQAVAITRARHFGAKLLILDEPTSALSLNQTEKVLSFIREAADSGIAVIFITHTLNHIENLVDRVVVLYHGRNVGDLTRGQWNQQRLANLINTGRAN